jgi:crotonobetainyl-CoA:carnitine CoA-transferase CaiB-like acyl-CoA transferase
MGSYKLSGIKVVEVAEYAVAPAAGAVLADWGADVVKVEHAVRGDAIRGIAIEGVKPGMGGLNFLFESVNRSKRSISLDLSKPEGREVILKLAAEADVFLCNYRESTRRKLGIDVDDIRAVRPDIVYGRVTAYGPRGAEVNRRGYDSLTWWYGTGAAVGGLPLDAPLPSPLPGPAFGDIQTGTHLAGGIAAALFHRERTGEGSVVDTSLLGSGVWAMSPTLLAINISGAEIGPVWDHKKVVNPLFNVYRTSDDRFVALNMLQADQYWSRFCVVIDREDLIDDPRYSTMALREANREECIAILDDVFATRPYDEWAKRLSEQDGIWGPVSRISDMAHDQQVWDNEFLQVVDYGDGRSVMLSPPPAQFDETAPVMRRAPEFGEHTEEILLEVGFDWPAIGELREKGAIG